MILSDQTLAEQLTARLRALQVFELFVFETGHDEVYISARWFDRNGTVCTTRGRANDLAIALVKLLAEIERELGPAKIIPSTSDCDDEAPAPARRRHASETERAAVITLLAEHGKVTRGLLAAKLSIGRYAARAILQSLAREGVLETAHSGFVRPGDRP